MGRYSGTNVEKSAIFARNGCQGRSDRGVCVGGGGVKPPYCEIL